MPGTLSPPPRVSNPGMHYGTCGTHVPWCMPGSLTSGFLWSRWWGKTFPAFPAHAQPPFYVFGKRPITPKSPLTAATSFSIMLSVASFSWHGGRLCVKSRSLQAGRLWERAKLSRHIRGTTKFVGSSAQCVIVFRTQNEIKNKSQNYTRFYYVTG